MQRNTQKRTEPELQLWEITAPKPKPNLGRHNNRRTQNHRAGRPVQSIKRRQAKRRRVLIYRCIALGILALFLAGVVKLTGIIYRGVLRHYDEGGKKCPLYYVDHEDEWEQLLNDVAEAIGN